MKVPAKYRACTWEDATKDMVPGCKNSGLCCTEDGATFFASPDTTNVVWICPDDTDRIDAEAVAKQFAELILERQRLKAGLKAIVAYGDAVSKEAAESALKG